MNNLAGDSKYASVLIKHRKGLEDWIKETDDKGQYPLDKEDLIRVYERAKGKVYNPEYEFIEK